MSERISHECGIAFIRLLKPLSFYRKKYGTPLYGLNKLYLLMEKQHNRGQDGAGVAGIKLGLPPGRKYISSYRTTAAQPIDNVFQRVQQDFRKLHRATDKQRNDDQWLKTHIEFMAELLLGHLRYGTYGKYSLENCHPVLRENNWMSRNLVLAGNFNMTNVDEMFGNLLDLGQHPIEQTDTLTMLEKIGHFLDDANKQCFEQYKAKGHDNKTISEMIAKNLDIRHLLWRSVKNVDGGYVMAGMIGHGDAFVLRDPAGIRPAFCYHDDEVAVAASERAALQTAFSLPLDAVQPIKPGHAFIVRRDGKVSQEKCREPIDEQGCSFERIYFSRGTDQSIYKERKQLGYQLVPAVLQSIDHDLDNTVFSFIPNTAEVAFYGLIQGMDEQLNKEKARQIKAAGNKMGEADLQQLLHQHPRVEKIAVKDSKLRTFITGDSGRDELVAHVYDVTYGVIRQDKDTLVVLDDSIVRGTTLRESILRILDRLGPKKIVVVSSAPQIRYPDCYGIDMSKLGSFAAFRAAIALLKEEGQENVLEIVYQACQEALEKPVEKMENAVKAVYAPFTAEQISEKIVEILKPNDMQADLHIIYQSLEGLHHAIPGHRGDWYFSGNYPTPGGHKVVNRSFINFYEGRDKRAY